MRFRLAAGLVGSFCFMLLAVSAKVVYDVESTSAAIPAVFENATLIDVVNPKRKHNPIDDFVLSRPLHRSID